MSTAVQPKKRRHTGAGGVFRVPPDLVRAIAFLETSSEADPKRTRKARAVLRDAEAFGVGSEAFAKLIAGPTERAVAEAIAVERRIEKANPELLQRLRRFKSRSREIGVPIGELLEEMLRGQEEAFGCGGELTRSSATQNEEELIPPYSAAANPSSSGAIKFDSALLPSRGGLKSPTAETGAASSADGDVLTVIDSGLPACTYTSQVLDSGDEPTAAVLGPPSEALPVAKSAKKGRAKARYDGSAAGDPEPADLQPTSDGDGTRPSTAGPSALDKIGQSGNSKGLFPKSNAFPFTKVYGHRPTNGPTAKTHKATEDLPEQLSMLTESAGWVHGTPEIDAVGGEPG